MQTNALSQYCMLTATYNVRPMAAKKKASGKSALFKERSDPEKNKKWIKEILLSIFNMSTLIN
jgi:hypothetical protein